MSEPSVPLSAMIDSLIRASGQLHTAYEEKNWIHLQVDARTVLSLASRIHARSTAIAEAQKELEAN